MDGAGGVSEASGEGLGSGGNAGFHKQLGARLAEVEVPENPQGAKIFGEEKANVAGPCGLVGEPKSAAEELAVLVLGKGDEKGTILAVRSADAVLALIQALPGAGAVGVGVLVALATRFEFGAEQGGENLHAEIAEHILGAMAGETGEGFFGEGKEVGIVEGAGFADLVASEGLGDAFGGGGRPDAFPETADVGIAGWNNFLLGEGTFSYFEADFPQDAIWTASASGQKAVISARLKGG